MTLEEIKRIWDSTPKEDIVDCQFSKVILDRILYKHPHSKLYMSSYNLIKLSNMSINKLEEYLSQMIITEQLYNHLGIVTIDDKKYHTLGRVFDIELVVEDINNILIIDNNVVHATLWGV